MVDSVLSASYVYFVYLQSIPEIDVDIPFY